MRRLSNTLVLFIVGLLVVGSAGLHAGGQQEDADEQQEDRESTADDLDPNVELDDSDFTEPPMLQELVQAGDLPPVEERLPDTPLVMAPEFEIGEYGGQIVRRMEDGGGFSAPLEPNLLLGRDLEESLPNVVEDYEFNDDGTEMTLYLRRGMRWSDGEPLTADDWLFLHNDMLQHTEAEDGSDGFVEWIPEQATQNWEPVAMEKLDDYTLRLTFPNTYFAVVHQMNLVRNNDYYGPQPRHWLERFHIDYNPDANELAQDAGYDEWSDYLAVMADYGSDDIGFREGRPTLSPWVFDESTPTADRYVRNPYYHKVDPQGNQLPYIDEYIALNIEDSEVLLTNAISGEIDFMAGYLSLEDFPTIRENEDAGGYESWVGENFQGAATVLVFNQTYRGDSRETLKPLLRDVNFRRALSLGVDRDQINEILMLGQGTPRQATLHPETAGYQAEWGEEHEYVDFDPQRANEYLDEIGLDERDSDGNRMYNGETVTLEIPVQSGVIPYWVPTMELIGETWQDELDLDVNIRTVGGDAMGERRSLSDAPIYVWVLDGTFGPAVVGDNGGFFSPSFWFQPMGPLYEYQEDEIAELDEDSERSPAPDEWMEINDSLGRLNALNEAEQQEVLAEVAQWHADNLWMIGTVGLIPQPVVSDRDLGNVNEERYPDAVDIGGERNFRLEQMFWTNEGRR